MQALSTKRLTLKYSYKQNNHMIQLRFSTLLALGLLSLNACAFGLQGSGIVQTQTRGVNPFNGFSVSNRVNANFTQNNQRASYEVKVTADHNLLPLIRTDVLSGLLTIQPAQRLDTNNQTVEINGPTVSSVAVSEFARANVDQLTGLPRTSLSASTNGFLSVNTLQTNNVEVQVVETANLTIGGGAATTLRATLSRSSRLLAEELLVQEAEITLTDRASARVNIQRQMIVNLGDNCTIYYKGNPQINQQGMGFNARLIPIDSSTP